MDTEETISAIDDVYWDYEKDPHFERMRLQVPGINLVPGQGPVPCQLMIIGEAPGGEENDKKKPFVGIAGQTLNEMLDMIDIPREYWFVTNIVKYRPMHPPNRNPTAYEISASLPYLTREVNIVNPTIIVPVGRIATQVFYPGIDPKHLRGKVHKRKGRLIIPTYHPAAVSYPGATHIRKTLTQQFELIRDVILQGE